MASRFSQYALAYARGLIRAFVPKRDGGPPIFTLGLGFLSAYL
jgi:hypothetical protein